MARPVISDPKRYAAYEPLYDFEPKTGASVEFFHADRVLAESFGMRGPAWFYWSCKPGSLPECLPTGPFATSYLAYRDFASRRLASAAPQNQLRPLGFPGETQRRKS